MILEVDVVKICSVSSTELTRFTQLADPTLQKIPSVGSDLHCKSGKNI